ncbi:MAG: hypothetical protein KAI81_03535 [Candidatus Marinimicrobia bacterium]|nr:hypothetical protein [Candidatus Neomarinimicrobiota bacterium]
MDPVQNVNSIAQITQVQRRENVRSNQAPPPPPPPAQDAAYHEPEISDTSRLLNALENQGFVSSQDMDQFRNDVKQSVQSGTFNAEEMADSAPEPVQNLAESQNIDLERAMNELAASYTQATYTPADANRTTSEQNYSVQAKAEDSVFAVTEDEQLGTEEINKIVNERRIEAANESIRREDEARDIDEKRAAREAVILERVSALEEGQVDVNAAEVKAVSDRTQEAQQAEEATQTNDAKAADLREEVAVASREEPVEASEDDVVTEAREREQAEMETKSEDN